MDPAHRLAVGDRVSLIVDRDGALAVTPATVVHQCGDRVELVGRAAEETGMPLVLVAYDGAERRFVAVEDSSLGEGFLAIQTWGPWQRAGDRRKSPRFPTRWPCKLRGGGRTLAGTCLDISLDGVAIETLDWDQRSFTLELNVGYERAALPCEAVAFEQRPRGVVVRARFDGISVEDGLALVGVIEADPGFVGAGERRPPGAGSAAPPRHPRVWR